MKKTSRGYKREITSLRQRIQFFWPGKVIVHKKEAVPKTRKLVVLDAKDPKFP